MTDRERFLATMQYKPVDRSPIWDFAFWDETLVVWKEQGLPDHVTMSNYPKWFGMDDMGVWPHASVGLYPGFPYEVLEDRGDQEVVRDWEGVISLRHKFMSSIPVHLGHTLVDRDSWTNEFLPKLQIDTPGRIAENFLSAVQDRPDAPRILPGPSLYGWIRNWMGVENVSLVVYDDEAWLEEMVEAITNLSLGVLEKILSSGVPFDACGMWEDMCYSGGPLLGVDHFKRILVPRYRRIVDLLHSYDVRTIWIDCDGNIDSLIPLWLQAGVNTMFPIEVGTWRHDPIKMRQEYGKDLLLMGGFDKLILKDGPAAIDREIQRLAPLVEAGGYIGFPDHRVPPDVPYTHYLHYLEQVRKVWGLDTNLKPMFTEMDEATPS